MVGVMNVPKIFANNNGKTRLVLIFTCLPVSHVLVFPYSSGSATGSNTYLTAGHILALNLKIQQNWTITP